MHSELGPIQENANRFPYTITLSHTLNWHIAGGVSALLLRLVILGRSGILNLL